MTSTTEPEPTTPKATRARRSAARQRTDQAKLPELRAEAARLELEARVATRQRASWAEEYRARAEQAAAELADLERQAGER